MRVYTHSLGALRKWSTPIHVYLPPTPDHLKLRNKGREPDASNARRRCRRDVDRPRDRCG